MISLKGEDTMKEVKSFTDVYCTFKVSTHPLHLSEKVNQNFASVIPTLLWGKPCLYEFGFR